MHRNVLKTASLLRRTGLLAALGLAAAVTVADIRRVASPIVVNSAADVADADPGDGVCETAPGNGVCTLRAAIQEANFASGATVTFSPSLPEPATFLLPLGHLTISSDLTITGRGATNTIIDADGSVNGDRAFLVNAGSATVAISDVTIQNGAAPASGTGGGVDLANTLTTLLLSNVVLTQNTAPVAGGALALYGTARLDHCAIVGNSTDIDGGAIDTAVTSHVVVTSSTIEGNSAGYGGALTMQGLASVTLIGCTIAGNSATNQGGAIEAAGGTLDLINTTLTGNHGTDGGGIYLAASGETLTFHARNATITENTCTATHTGCGIYAVVSPDVTASIANTILAKNFQSTKVGLISNDCTTVDSEDYNLIETTLGCTISGAASNNIYGKDPKLSPLQDNGGPTSTFALLDGSPAIDAGNPAGCTDNFGATLTADQRGFVRPVGGRCDMGAYEFDSPGPPTPTPTPTRTRTPTSSATRTPTRTPTAAASSIVPEALVVDPSGDGVLEPGETAVVDPAWKNAGGSPISLTSTASSFTGAGGATYSIVDGSAAYGTIAAGTTVGCAASSNCFAMMVSPIGSRPATHWDATFTETPSSGAAKIWTLHIGKSFSDVPVSQPFYKKTETLLHSGITTGCTGTTYCPADNVPRSQMAIFIAKGIAGGGGNVPASGTVGSSAYNCSAGGVSLFSDVSPTDIFCKHVHYIASKNVTSGCSAGKYCPTDDVSRLEMASFIAKAVVAPNGGPAIPMTYGPDPVTGLSYSCTAGSPNIHFIDVPATDSFCRHVHYLWAKGIIAGCTSTTYCPTGTVSRDQMAKFLVNAFALSLYEP